MLILTLRNQTNSLLRVSNDRNEALLTHSRLAVCQAYIYRPRAELELSVSGSSLVLPCGLPLLYTRF